MSWLLAGFLCSFFLAVVLTHRVRALALERAWVDMPDGERRVHEQPTPRVGGIAVVGTVVLVLLVGLLFLPGSLGVREDITPLLALVAGGGAIFLLGLWDDVRGMSASAKFVGQVIIATAVFVAGVRIGGFTLPGGYVELPFLVSAFLTVGWLVLIANAFNLIDGSDGVAAGAALFAAVAIGVASLFGSNYYGAFLAFVVAGATLGFLFFNFPPASIFLGDCGSLFLGFMLAGVGVITSQKGPTALAIAIPVVSFGLPILDTMLAVVRRVLRREGIFNADRGHIHHRLLDLGHSPRNVALLLYGISAAFGLVSLLLIQPSGASLAIVFIVVGAGMFLVVQRLSIPELVELRRILGRGVQQRLVIGHNVRIRESVVRIRRARRSEDIFLALAHAFAAGEFTRAEVRLHPAFPGSVGRVNGTSPRDRASCWVWTRPGVEGSGQGWEMALPFRNEAGEAVGELALWHPEDSEHLLTDIRLLAVELRPALQAALTRMSAEIAARIASRETTAGPGPALQPSPARRSIDGAARIPLSGAAPDGLPVPGVSPSG
jgi:UDP-GlcNAc:undecaprenyl-phosphate/decaprenyl-phosphate GlcNAc-1-phosphate transferase